MITSRSVPVTVFQQSIGSATMSLTRRRGLSELMGSWKIICMRVRALRSAPPFKVVTSVPSSEIVPLLGSIMRMSALPVVDLPQPDSPTSPSVSPSKMSKLTPATALTQCGPWPNVTVKSRTRSSGWFRSITTRLPLGCSSAGSSRQRGGRAHWRDSVPGVPCDSGRWRRRNVARNCIRR